MSRPLRQPPFDPRILILDDASSVDSESEAQFQAAVEQPMRGRTSLVIAHRLSTVQNAGRIIVVHHGELWEIGPHEELLERRGCTRASTTSSS